MLSRRHFLSGALALPALAQKKAAIERPNVVLLIADSLPAWMLGCYGNKEIRTPNLDRLAQGGVRFSNHFAASSGALANRASLLSGRTPAQLRVDDQVPESFSSEVLISDALAAAGYTCGFAGRWGLGNDSQPRHHFTSWQPATGAQVTAKAAEFIGQQTAGRPFLLTVSWPAATEPPAQKYLDLYAQAKLDTVNYEPQAKNAAAHKEMFKATLANLRKTAAAVTAFDDQIPPLLEALSRRGVLDKTLIVFTSAGGALAGRHGLWGDGAASDPVNMYDETVALPLLCRWPERIPPSTVRTELVSTYDLMPTLCDTASVPVPARSLNGRSYFTLAMSKPLPRKDPWKTQVFASYRNANMVRENRFKLVLRNNSDGPNELFDIANDARERLNQYANPQFMTVAERLSLDIAGWRKRYS